MMKKQSWDINFVRSQFPAFKNEVSAETIFLENAGGTYVPRQVIDHLNKFMISTKVQPYGPYSLSQEGTEAIHQATKKMAEMINAEESEIVLGHCTTMNFYLLSMALHNQFQPGDEIIITNQDHESNISPWRRLKEYGLKIREWKINPGSGFLNPDDLDDLISTKTRLVCMPHSSNIIGSVNDVTIVADKVHAVNGWLLVDGVSYAPHHAVDVKALKADIYCLSLYKVFGPHLGLMFVSEKLHPYLENQSLEFQPELYEKYRQPGSPNFLRIALNPGLVNHEEVASLLGLVEYFDRIYYHHYEQEEELFHKRVVCIHELIQDHETQLAKKWLSYVSQQPKMQLIGSTETDSRFRSPTWSFCLKGKSTRSIAEQLAKNNIAVQSGSFYAWRCLQALNINSDPGVLRISLAHINTIDEIEQLCTVMDEILS